MATNHAESDEVFRFTAKYFADLDAGGARTLAEYLELFPAFPGRIRQAFDELESPPDQTARPVPAADHAGETIGPYRVLGELGRGGQGVVYLAEDTRLQRRVALKVLRGFGAESHGMRARLAREAEAASKLDDPGICTVYEVGEVGGLPFIAMRFVDGAPLSAAIADERAAAVDPTDPDSTTSTGPGTRDELSQAVAQIESVARSLHAAHEVGLVHRDIKPGNIILTRDGKPVVLDFGLVRDETSTDHALTKTGDVLGTPAYMSPEQLNGERVDRRTDVYSLGATLYERLTLRRPFDAPTREQLYQRILTTSAPVAHRLNPRIPRDLEVVLETALEKDPDRRYQTALDLAEDLERFRTFQPIRARPTPLPLRMRRWVQRNRAATGILVLVTVGLALSLWLLQRSEEALRHQQLLGLVAESEKALATDPMLALLLAREAVRNDGTFEAVSQLHRVLAAPQPSAILRSRMEVHWSHVAVASKSARLAAYAPSTFEGHRHFLALFEPTGREVVTIETADRRPIAHVEVSPDGDRIAILLQGLAGLQFLDDEGRVLRTIADGTSIAPTADGVLVCRGQGPKSRVTQHDWNGVLLTEFAGTPAPVAVARERDGRHVLVCIDGTVQLRDADGKLVVARKIPRRSDDPSAPPEWPTDADYCAKTSTIVAGFARSTPPQRGRVFVVRDTGRSWESSVIVSMDGEFELSRRGDRLLTVDPPPAGSAVSTTARLHELDATRARPIHRTGAATQLVVYRVGVEPFGFARDGESFFTVHVDGAVVVWNADGRILRTFHDFVEPAAQFSPDGKHLVISRANVTKLFDAAGVETHHFRTPSETSSTPVFLDDGAAVLTVGATMYRWELREETLRTYRGHGSPLVGVAAAADGRVATGTELEGMCRLWDGKSVRPRVLGEEYAFSHPKRRVFVEFTPDGDELLHGSMDFRNPVPRLRDGRTGGSERVLVGHEVPAWDACFTADGRYLVTGGVDGAVRRLDRARHEWKTYRVPGAGPRPTGIVYGVDARDGRILSAHGDGVCRLWEMAGDGAPREFATGGRRVAANNARFLDSRTFIACYADETVRVWDLDGTAPPRVLAGAKAFLLEVSPTRDRIACVARDGARLLDRDGRLLAELRGHRDRVEALCFTPDGKYLLTGSADRTARTWFVRTSDLLDHADRKAIRELSELERRRFARLLDPGR